MILATVGTQLPFPRLIDALDRIAGRLAVRVVAQTCEDTRDRRHVEEHRMLDAPAFERLAGDARLIVGHAGIGTLLTARRAAKPVVLFPRRASLGEHRNEHQLATVAALGDREGIHVALDEAALEALLTRTDLAPFRPGESPRRQELIGAVSRFLSA